MNKLRFVALRAGRKRLRVIGECQRNISTLYISGDKTKENYVVLRPYMDFEGTLSNTALIEESLAARRWNVDMKSVHRKYNEYRNITQQIEKLNEDRDTVTNKIKELSEDNRTTKDEKNALKERGKTLRSCLKSLKEKSYPIEEDFVHTFLNLPNTLHSHCPRENVEKLVYRSTIPRHKGPSPASHLNNTKLIRFLNNNRYYMFGPAAEFDVYSMQALANYYAGTHNFLQMANPDFVRQVLLEASALPIGRYHLVIGEHTPTNINPTYLVGGGTFESFLGAFARMCIYPSILPLRLVACGRSYEKVTMSEGQTANLYTATQTNAVTTFAATQTAQEADHQMEEILNVAVNFYKEIGIHFRIVYADASKLTGAESLRAIIEVYSPVEKRYICVGSVSNYGDFISKRILFCIRMKKKYDFPHLVGGPIVYTSRLIAVLIEHGIKLDQCKLLGSLVSKSAVEDFKKLVE